MRWKDEGAYDYIIIESRKYNLTGRWQQFWNKIQQFGLRFLSDTLCLINTRTGTFYHKHYLVKETPIGAINAPSEHNFGDD